MRVLVCGSRTWTDRRIIHAVLNGLSWDATTPDEDGREDDLTLIVGGARGADSIAEHWGSLDGGGIALEVYPADWEQYGRGAGPVRNHRMLDEGRPDLVVAFTEQPPTPGTAHMIRITKKAGVPVWVVSHG